MPPVIPLVGAPRGAHLPDAHWLEERYRGAGGSRASVRAYYRVKPLLPRRVQLALRRRYARRLRGHYEHGDGFPAWPADETLTRRHTEALEAAVREVGGVATVVEPWPCGHRCAVIVTHDVEGPAGVAAIPEILALEAAHGIRSSWNFVGDDYPVPETALDAVRAAGGEIGVHGLHHDGRLFETHAGFRAALPGIQARFAQWGAVGFRSPATHRNPDWMPELGCDYDSSFPDTDPFEPQPGGCCSILPFFLDDLVELPITLVQDHTLFEILREPDNRLWESKAEWIAERGGLVTALTHPDYLLTPARRNRYDALLGRLTALDNAWHALPRDVAAWWRRRDSLERRLLAGEDAADDLRAAGARLRTVSTDPAATKQQVVSR